MDHQFNMDIAHNRIKLEAIMNDNYGLFVFNLFEESR